ncbi:MAG: cupredoxin domain-containing protein [Acidimicrobiia bacterium]
MRALAAALLLFVLQACGGAPQPATRVELAEFSVSVEHPVWKAGRIQLAVENSGAFPHTLVVTTDDGTVVVASPVLQPDEAIELDLDLEPGTYHLSCRLVVETDDGMLVDHFQRGMHATVAVRGG